MANLLKEQLDEIVELYFENYNLKEIIKHVKES